MEEDPVTSTQTEPIRIGPPNKRPRLDELPDGQLAPLNHDSEIWFADGNVVLVCKDTGFRVHSGVLSAHCQVFRDMFSTGRPAAGEMHEGADVIQLTDAVVGVRLFLTSLYFRA